MREQLAEREGQITRRDQTIVANEGQINGLTKEVETLKISLEKSEDKLRFKSAHVDRLEAELKVQKESRDEEVEHLQENMDEIKKQQEERERRLLRK